MGCRAASPCAEYATAINRQHLECAARLWSSGLFVQPEVLIRSVWRHTKSIFLFFRSKGVDIPVIDVWMTAATVLPYTSVARLIETASIWERDKFRRSGTRWIEWTSIRAEYNGLMSEALRTLSPRMRAAFRSRYLELGQPSTAAASDAVSTCARAPPSYRMTCAKSKDICPICQSAEPGDRIIGMCGHPFHPGCLFEWAGKGRHNSCPSCRAKIY